jgi:peroxiredoxin
MGRLAKELKGGDFIMIPINVQEPPALVRAFIEEYEVDFPVYLDEQAEAARAMGVNGLPTTVLIDRNGNATALAVGALEWDDEAVIDMFKDWAR